LRERIEDRVREMRESCGPALRERFVEEAAASGMTLEEAVQVESAGAVRRRTATGRGVTVPVESTVPAVRNSKIIGHTR
jgi:hypothetical protein